MQNQSDRQPEPSPDGPRPPEAKQQSPGERPVIDAHRDGEQQQYHAGERILIKKRRSRAGSRRESADRRQTEPAPTRYRVRKRSTRDRPSESSTEMSGNNVNPAAAAAKPGASRPGPNSPMRTTRRGRLEQRPRRGVENQGGEASPKQCARTANPRRRPEDREGPKTAPRGPTPLSAEVPRRRQSQLRRRALGPGPAQMPQRKS